MKPVLTTEAPSFQHLSIYWKLTLFLKRKYPLYWIIVGTLLFLFSEIALLTSNNKPFVLTEIFLAYFIIAGLPIVTLFGARVFDAFPIKFSNLFEDGDNALSSLVFSEGRRIFDYRYWPMWIVSLINNLLCTLTLLAVGTFFEFKFANVAMLIILQPVFFFCGQTCYAMVMLGGFFYKLVRLPLATKFNDYAHREVTILSRYSYFLAMCGLLEYLGLFVAIRLGPYRDSVWMLPWLITLAFTPIVVFGWGTYQVHVLQRETKFKNVESINSEVRKVFDELKVKTSLDNIERLAKMIEIQKRIEETREWPVALGTILTLLLTAAAAVAQVLAAIATLSINRGP